MDIKEINKVFRDKAIAAGLCEDWQKNIWNRDLSLDELLEIYIKGMDFSLKQEWFDYSFAKEAFPKEVFHRNHIYIDEHVEIDDAESGRWVILGDCTGNITFRDFSVGTVYVRHTSDIYIEAFDMAKVFVSAHDSAKVRQFHSRGATLRFYDRRK